MAELTPSERLQPSLLDRLTDDHPDQAQESRSQRVMSLRRYREGVLRDLSWLLNTVWLSAVQDLSDAPLAERSVINFGIPDLAGGSASRIDQAELETRVRQAIWDYEPRIIKRTVKVRVASDLNRVSHNALSLEVEGELWAQPVPERLYLKTDMDIETGAVSIKDYMDAGGP